MKNTRIPSLILAAVLHVMPICRVATVTPGAASTTYAIVAHCAVAIAALLGSVDAVSGASTAVYVAGVQRFLPAPTQPVSTNVVGPVGSPMVLRIVLGGSVGQQPQLDYYNAYPLPPGLMINTNVNTNSSGLESTNYYIYGTPTTPGVYFPVTVSAGNLLYAGGPVYTNIKITITNTTGGGSAPSFTTQPQSRTTTNGSNVSFSVVVTGSPAPTLQWRKNSTNSIAGATGATYSLSPATTNSAGSYACVASNSSGSITSLAAVLTVLDPPSIATQPQSLTVSNGAPASFQVVAFGIPPPAYQWKFNGTNIAGANAASYVINSAGATNVGDYTVVLSNSVNSLVSASAHLTVQFPVSPPTLGGPQLEGGRPAFNVMGPANVNVVILSATVLGPSAELTVWTPVRTNATPSGTWHFQDLNAVSSGARFYRAVVQP